MDLFWTIAGIVFDFFSFSLAFSAYKRITATTVKTIEQQRTHEKIYYGFWITWNICVTSTLRINLVRNEDAFTASAILLLMLLQSLLLLLLWFSTQINGWMNRRMTLHRDRRFSFQQQSFAHRADWLHVGGAHSFASLISRIPVFVTWSKYLLFLMNCTIISFVVLSNCDNIMFKLIGFWLWFAFMLDLDYMVRCVRNSMDFSPTPDTLFVYYTPTENPITSAWVYSEHCIYANHHVSESMSEMGECSFIHPPNMNMDLIFRIISNFDGIHQPIFFFSFVDFEGERERLS